MTEKVIKGPEKVGEVINAGYQPAPKEKPITEGYQPKPHPQNVIVPPPPPKKPAK